MDRTVGDASPDDYDALVLPGGVANADQLRTDPQAVHFVRRMFEADKPAAVICHGPWILADACPAMRPQPVPVGAPPPAAAPLAPTVGLVSTFEAGDSRLQQRGTRPYEVVRKAETPPSESFRLTLEGRIVDDAGGPVVCRSDDPDRPPLCLVRVELDRVAIEGAAGELFGEWR